MELKNGETYNGELVACDNWMNIRCVRPDDANACCCRARAPYRPRLRMPCRSLRGVICTSRDGDRFWRLPEVIIRGNNIKYLRIPEEVIGMVPEEDLSAKPGKGGGKGEGRGRGGKGGGKGEGGKGGRGRGGGRGGEGRGAGRAAGRGHAH